MQNQDGADLFRVGHHLKNLARILITLVLAISFCGQAMAASKPRMRGRIQTVTPPRYDPLTLGSLPASVPIAISPISGSPAPGGIRPTAVTPLACRQQCNRSYYFCLSNDGSEDCSARWVPCTSTCARMAGSMP